MFSARVACFAASSLLSPPVSPCPRCRVRAPCRSMALLRSRSGGSKQKIGSQYNFFAIRDYCRSFQSQIGSQKRRWSASERLISALKRQRRVPNRKKVAKAFGFLFCGKRIAIAGQIPKRLDCRSGADCTTGRIRKRADRYNRVDRRSGADPEKGRLHKGLVQRGMHPPASILLRFLLAVMLQFV